MNGTLGEARVPTNADAPDIEAILIEENGIDRLLGGMDDVARQVAEVQVSVS